MKYNFYFGQMIVIHTLYFVKNARGGNLSVALATKCKTAIIASVHMLRRIIRACCLDKVSHLNIPF